VLAVDPGLAQIKHRSTTVVEDLVQVVSSQEKELAEKSTLVMDLQKQLENSGNFLLHYFFDKLLYRCAS
jgi:hypothetical protein